MNWDQADGRWKQLKGKVREKWGKLTDDDLDTINGKREHLVGTIQRRYGDAREVAEKQVKEWEDQLEQAVAEKEEEAERSSVRVESSASRRMDSEHGAHPQGRTFGSKHSDEPQGDG